MMTKDFEKYFPLPWEVKIIDTATFIQSEFEPGEHTIKFNADNIAHVDALEYMVKCANLMPEIAHDLKLFFDRRAYIRSPVSEVDLKRLYNRIAELVGTAQIEETELPD